MLTAASNQLDINATLERLLTLHPKRIDLALDRIGRLLTALGNPEYALAPVIHIAGTNGKGSVASFLRAILVEAGYRVNAYTSPHLVHFRERIWLAGQDSALGAAITNDALANVLAECEAANGLEPITFFEVTTAAAFLAFSRNPADVTLVEVGLGGTYDATNVISNKALNIITPIDYDHQNFLGTSLEQIAGEKAGILRRAVSGIIGKQDEDALAIIKHRATEIGAPLIVQDQDFIAHEEHGRLVFEDVKGLVDLPLPRLAGRHQIDNAAIAIAAVRALDKFSVSADALGNGMRKAHWPGRLQQLKPDYILEDDWLGELPEIWLDGGHNPAAGRVLAEAMADLEERVPRPLYLIVAMMNNKDAQGFLKPFQTLACKVIALPLPGQENGMAADDLADAAQAADLPSEKADDLASAFQSVLRDVNLSANEDESPRLLICGSLYLAGYILERYRAVS